MEENTYVVKSKFKFSTEYFFSFVIINLGRYPDLLNPNLKPSGCTCSWYTARERGRLKDSSGVDAGEYSAGVREEIQTLRTGQLAPYRQYNNTLKGLFHEMNY